MFKIIHTFDLISIILYYYATNGTGPDPIRHKFWELNPFPRRSNRNFRIHRLGIIHFRILFEFFIRPTIGSKINRQFILLLMCTLQQTSNWCSLFRLAPRNLFVIAPALGVYRKHNNSSRNSFCLRLCIKRKPIIILRLRVKRVSHYTGGSRLDDIGICNN